MDISEDEGLSVNFTRRIETARFGLFIFQVGVDEHEAAMPLQRVADAQERFLSALLSRWRAFWSRKFWSAASLAPIPLKEAR